MEEHGGALRASQEFQAYVDPILQERRSDPGDDLLSTLATTEVASQGNLAYEVGTYEMKTKDGKVADRGKYCVVWKKVGGKWLLHRDIWTTNLPEVKK